MTFGIIRGGLMAASALLVLSTAGQAAPVMHSPHAKASHGVARSAGDRRLAVLFDQTGDESGIATVSQNFGDEFSSAAADDFPVPAGKTWTIKEVDALGVYFNGSGPTDSVDVTSTWGANAEHQVGSPLAKL